ncbi:antibiotic biosynthesis monooxygenase [Galbibacter sp. EGI 63066]|uniref:antibiotic biosynthesis monooxygenase family protein n=1 Tax=Galbibacter sp. EGI 63066 TaxID=2993559 RepID=UPI002248E233|nr:antibiotic biosynthesis monooxygenase [Galbibacter sp. EGI 63066]MCX2679572.1 antibiotic biosynthesis monooxygenase [Galbibacter sp. EGI 63066]
MIVVIFEAWIKQGQKEEYFDIASKLKNELSKVDGFISIERFQSVSVPDKLLSLSVWRDEEAVKKWRNIEMHRQAQSKGRQSIFKDYRIRIGSVVRDYGLLNRKESPKDSKVTHGL